MSLSVAVLRVENPDIPADCDATVQAGLLVCALERQGHRVQRWRVHFHHLEALYAELAAEGCEVFAIEAAVPLDVLERLCRREPKPALILFGPLASSHLLQTPAPVAVLENTETTVALLQAITIAPSLTTNEPGLALGLGAAAPVERWLPRERLAGIPDLLFRCEEPRMPPVAHTMGTESPFETPRVPSSDTSMNPARPTHTIECSRAHRPWSPEAELTSYAAPLIWNSSVYDLTSVSRSDCICRFIF